ncbi:Uncharacterized protein dnm_060100 [Desulfonema magnum]|uniref:Uncharacterized protein n=1 Tax=Desulfonema magnum TaxID=45655 RepID=A0A975GQE3_9BACT|nr:Uncharacterized protein dnm_060100 [Desulfonema magnum]
MSIFICLFCSKQNLSTGYNHFGIISIIIIRSGQSEFLYMNKYQKYEYNSLLPLQDYPKF